MWWGLWATLLFWEDTGDPEGSEDPPPREPPPGAIMPDTKPIPQKVEPDILPVLISQTDTPYTHQK